MPETKIRRFPNVRDVQHSNEINALKKRYHKVTSKRAKRNNPDNALFYFEYFLKKTSATINVSLTVLLNLIEDLAVYHNYYQRLSFEPEKYDEDREFVDVILFGKYRQYIRYVALNLNGSGLTAYGQYCIYLKTQHIEEKTSLLEENSFIFFDKYRISPFEPQVPYGYRSDWENRGKLAVAKLGHKIKNGMQANDFANILLKNTGDKAKDDFIEVHIFGEFNCQSIDFVVKSPKIGQTQLGQKIEQKRINFVKEKLATLGKKWVEA